MDVPILPQLELPILPQCSNKTYWTIDTQNCTLRNNSKHTVAYHIDTPWNISIHRLPSTALKTMNSFFLTPMIQNENAHFHIQILHIKWSARRVLGILLLSFLVFRKETIAVFPPSPLWNIAFQLLPILPPYPHLAPSSPTHEHWITAKFWNSEDFCFQF